MVATKRQDFRNMEVGSSEEFFRRYTQYADKMELNKLDGWTKWLVFEIWQLWGKEILLVG